jgi:hydroxyacylglutathione hydrolase
MPSSTLGYERRTNWAFGVKSEAEFVAAVLEGQPSPPTYFAMMKHINKIGAPVLGNATPIEDLDIGDFAWAMADGVVLDVRPRSSWSEGHLGGTINIPLIKAFTTWAGWLLPYDQSIALIALSSADATEARRALASIGLDRVRGAFSPAAYAALEQTRGIASAKQGDIRKAESLIASGRPVIDLREAGEWAAGHIPGAEHHPLGSVRAGLAERDRTTPLAIHCQAGTRSAIGASVLEAMGFTDVIDLTDGFAAWWAAGHEAGR